MTTLIGPLKTLSLIDLPISELDIYKMVFMAVLYESDSFIQNANMSPVASIIGLWVSCNLARPDSGPRMLSIRFRSTSSIPCPRTQAKRASAAWGIFFAR